MRIIAIAENKIPQAVVRRKCKETIEIWRLKGKDLIAVWVHRKYPKDDFGRLQWFAMASYDYKDGFKFNDKR